MITPLITNKINPRWIALRMLDGDIKILERISQNSYCKGACNHG